MKLEVRRKQWWLFGDDVETRILQFAIFLKILIKRQLHINHDSHDAGISESWYQDACIHTF